MSERRIISGWQAASGAASGKVPSGGSAISEAPVGNLSPVLTNDPVNKPAHYREHPSGIECIQVTEHMGFNLGNAIKYIWRCDLKKDAIEDLEKAKWYIQREIDKRKK